MREEYGRAFASSTITASAGYTERMKLRTRTFDKIHLIATGHLKKESDTPYSCGIIVGADKAFDSKLSAWEIVSNSKLNYDCYWVESIRSGERGTTSVEHFRLLED